MRADFERKYGTPAAEAMDRHEAELTKLQEETLKAALGPAKNWSVRSPEGKAPRSRLSSVPEASMTRVTGIGGIFFKARDPKALQEWYRRHLGLPLEEWGGAVFHWQTPERPEPDGMTVWNIFPAETKYFDPSPAPFMVNFRVDDLDALLAALREEGCAVDEKVEKSEFGAFGWVMDPEGNRVELWQPPKR